MNTKINVFTYYGNLERLFDFYDLPVNGIGIDFVDGIDNFDNILEVGFPNDKTLFAGGASTSQLRDLSEIIDNIYVTNSKPLYHYNIEESKNILENISSLTRERVNE